MANNIYQDRREWLELSIFIGLLQLFFKNCQQVDVFCSEIRTIHATVEKKCVDDVSPIIEQRPILFAAISQIQYLNGRDGSWTQPFHSPRKIKFHLSFTFIHQRSER